MRQSTNNPNRGERSTSRPVHSIRYGAVRAAIWKNIVDRGNNSRPMYSATFGRSYKDGENNWKDSTSFGPDDLLQLAKAANEAHSYICDARQKEAPR